MDNKNLWPIIPHCGGRNCTREKREANNWLMAKLVPATDRYQQRVLISKWEKEWEQNAEVIPFCGSDCLLRFILTELQPEEKSAASSPD